MDERVEEDEQGDLVNRLFVAMTVELEDLATLAANGQARGSLPHARRRALQLRSRADLVCVLADAAAALAPR